MLFNRVLTLLNLKVVSQLILLLLFITLTHIAFGFKFRVIYVFSVFLLLVSISSYRLIYKVFIICSSLMAAIYFPTGILYGNPSFNIATALLYTDKIESFEYLKNIPYYYHLLSFFILLLGIYCCKFKFNVKGNFKVFFLSVFFICSLLSPVKRWLINNEFFTLKNMGFNELKFIVNAVSFINEAINEKNIMFEILSKEDDYPRLMSNGSYNTYVLVIGESARKDLMHTYGFEVNNTPFLDEINGKIFTNYISAASGTVSSLINTISEPSKLQNNIIALANKSEFSTYWISNQGESGVNDSPIASIGKRAKKDIFIKNGDFTSSELDSDLLPYINKAINENRNHKKLIVIHLMGSHSPVCLRIKESYDIFYLSPEVSCYIQSIKETDQLLKSIYDALSMSKTKWSMMYLSDHGVSFSKKSILADYTLLHGSSYQENFMVPFFISSYNDVKREYINTRVSGFDFLSLFSEWLGIHMYEKPDCKMISNQNCKFRNEVLDVNKELINIEQLPNDSIPKF